MSLPFIPPSGLMPKAYHLWIRSRVKREQLSDALRKLRLESSAIASSAAGETTLAIFDDIFPSASSGFRNAEYEAYFARFPHANVFSEGAGAPHPRRFQLPAEAARLKGAKLGYTILLHNAHHYLPYFEYAKAPFVFTCYPGGGLRLGDEYANERLKRIAASPSFRGVITTQRVTHEYLLGLRLFDERRVHYIYGAPMTPPEPRKDGAADPRDSAEKISVCFVAHKYTPQGADKGYPVFVELAELICRDRSDVEFHVVGPFEGEVPLSHAVAARTTFHGVLGNAQLAALLETQHLIVSPNIAFYLAPGAFDGFPTAACNEAGVRGVVVAATDPLGLNPGLVDGEEIVLIPPSARGAYERLEPLLADRARLKAVSVAGAAKFRELFSHEKQIEPRLKLLDGLMG